MSILKAAATGAIGFALGAGAMLMPGNQKLKRKAQEKMMMWKKLMSKM